MSLLRASVADTPTRPMTLMVALGLAESGTEVSPFWISGAFTYIARLWSLILLAKLCISLLLSLSPLSGGAVSLGIFAAMLTIDVVLMISVSIVTAGLVISVAAQNDTTKEATSKPSVVS